MSATAIHERPAELLQQLIRFDTTNPPGRERELIEWVQQLLDGSGATVRLCLLSDEEARGDQGARFVVEEHPELFEGVRFAIGEFGGFTLDIAGRRFYPIMVAEKQICVAHATLRGPAGHGALPVRDGAMGRLGRVLAALDRRRLPVHVTPVARAMVEGIAAEVPAPVAVPLRALLRPRLTDRVLDVMGDRAKVFDPILHSTASATIVGGGQSANVIPGEVSVTLDFRLLPGFTPEDAFAELRTLAGVDVEFEIVRHDPGTATPDVALFDTLGAILRELDPAALPVPLLFPAVTDGRFFARLGIQTYGFLPMQLPAEMRFMDLIHAENERIPVDAVEFGTRAMRRLLERFGGVR